MKFVGLLFAIVSSVQIFAQDNGVQNDCKNTAILLKSYQKKTSNYDQAALALVEKIARVSKDWSKKFKPLEDVETAFQVGQFEEVHQTVPQVKSEISEANTHFSELADQLSPLLDQIKGCLSNGSPLPQLLETYNDEARRQEGGVSIYLSGPDARLDQLDQALSQIEGQTTTLKKGYFDLLDKIADDAVEAHEMMSLDFKQFDGRLTDLILKLEAELTTPVTITP